MSRTVIESKGGLRFKVGEVNPLGNCILFKEIRQTRRGQIVIPENCEQPGTECLVGRAVRIGAGPFYPETDAGPRCMPFENIEPGDILLAMQYAGERVEIEGEKYRLLNYGGIWAKVKIEGPDEELNIVDVEPYSDHLLVKKNEDDKTLSGVLALPREIQTAWARAKVVKVGPGMRDPTTGEIIPIRDAVHVGENVFMLRFAGADVFIKGEKFRLCHYRDLLAAFEEEEESANGK